MENGEYEWGSGFGFADLENNVPASEHTLFRLASISKSLTATGAMQLWEGGQLDLDAPVQKYCSAFPQKPWPITTRRVMGHLAGIRHYKGSSQDDPEVGNTKHFDNPIQAGLDFLKNDPLLSEPGKQFHYSTQGYTLVGCVMEGASGAKYVDFMRQNVFAPAGMEHTQVDDRFAIVPYRTRFYEKPRFGHGAECGLPRLQLQDSGRRLVVVGGRHGAFRSGDPERQADAARDARFDVDAAEAVRGTRERL